MDLGERFVKHTALSCFLEGACCPFVNTGEFHNYLMSEGWAIHPVHYKKEIIGAIVERDEEVHVSIATNFQKRWNPRPYIKKILYPKLDKYKEVSSDAAKNDIRAQRWLLRLGFEQLNEDDERIYYRLTQKIF